MKKKITTILAMALCLCIGSFAFAACDNTSAVSDYITKAIARPSSSGTRGAFDELVSNDDGNTLAKVETFASCVSEVSETGSVITEITNNTAGDTLGYISLGSVAGNSGIKAVKVGGVEATVANINNGSYVLSRPFNLVYSDTFSGVSELSELAQDFIRFIESTQGQEIINEEWIGQVSSTTDYVANSYSGTETTLTLWGSTSVTPLMNQLKEAYLALNTAKTLTIEVGGAGSGEGITYANKADSSVLGMISRELKSSETGLSTYKLADDGIAIIVNADCKLTNVTLTELYNLYASGTQITCD